MKGGCMFHLGREKEDGESEKQGGEKEKSPRCQQEDRGRKKEKGVEVLGVLVVGRGAGIQGNGLFLIIIPPPPTTTTKHTHTQKRPPHGPMTTLSWPIHMHTH